MYKAEVYPAYNARNYAQFVEALRTLLGANNVRFTTRDFPRFGPNCLAFRIGPEPARRIFLHAQDPSDLNPDGLEWCDVFGKVNLLPEDVGGKVVPLGPTFPFRACGPVEAAWRGVATFWRGRGHTNRFRKHFGDHRGQSATRFYESFYTPGEAEPGYIFFNASIWEFEKEGNDTRARFVEACRTVPGIRFEGGLSPRDSIGGEAGWKAREYSPYISRRYSPEENLAKSRLSLVTLNNPSCLDCHSWRFAEQLALGKAIISTPLKRAVPAPLVHGEHMHYVDGTVDSFREAIRTIAFDDDYRRQLERNARRYYEEYLTPTRSISRMIEAAGIILHRGLMRAGRGRHQPERLQKAG